MKKVKQLPRYKKWTSQLRININGREYRVFQSLRSYGIGRNARMFVNIDGNWFELEDKEKLDVY
jgi:hypothetical protein